MCLRRTAQTFRRVPWSGALKVEDYQRLRLRLMGVYLVLAGISLLASLFYMLGTRLVLSTWLSNTLFAGLVLAVLVGVPLAIVAILQSIKIDLARLHDFNVPTGRALGLLAAAVSVLVAFGVADSVHGTSLVLWGGLVWSVAYALYTYYLFFVAAPRPTAYVAAKPFPAAPGRTETTLLFLFQTGIWFNILYEPLSYAFQH